MSRLLDLNKNLSTDYFIRKVETLCDFPVAMNVDTWSSTEEKCILNTLHDTINWIKNHFNFLCEISIKLEDQTECGVTRSFLQNINQGRDDREVRLNHAMGLLIKLRDQNFNGCYKKKIYNCLSFGKESVDISQQIPPEDINIFSGLYFSKVRSKEYNVNDSGKIIFKSLTIPPFDQPSQRLEYIIEMYNSEDYEYLLEFAKSIKVQLLTLHELSAKIEHFLMQLIDFDNSLLKEREVFVEWCEIQNQRLIDFTEKIAFIRVIQEIGYEHGEKNNFVLQKKMTDAYQSSLRDLTEIYDSIKIQCDRMDSLQQKLKGIGEIDIQNYGVDNERVIITLTPSNIRSVLLENDMSNLKYLQTRFREIYNACQSMNNVCNHEISLTISDEEYNFTLHQSLMRLLYTVFTMSKCLLDECHNAESKLEVETETEQSADSFDDDSLCVFSELTKVSEKIHRAKLICVTFSFMEPIIDFFEKFPPVKKPIQALSKSDQTETNNNSYSMKEMSSFVRSFITTELAMLKLMLLSSAEKMENHIWMIFSNYQYWYLTEFYKSSPELFRKCVKDIKSKIEKCCTLVSLFNGCLGDYMLIYQQKLLKDNEYVLESLSRVKQLNLCSRRIRDAWDWLCEYSRSTENVLQNAIYFYEQTNYFFETGYQIYNLSHQIYTRLLPLTEIHDRHALLLRINMLKNTKSSLCVIKEQLIGMRSKFRSVEDQHKRHLKSSSIDYGKTNSISSTINTDTENSKCESLTNTNGKYSINEMLSRAANGIVEKLNEILVVQNLIDEWNTEMDEKCRKTVDRLNSLQRAINKSSQLSSIINDLEVFSRKLHEVKSLTLSQDQSDQRHLYIYLKNLRDITELKSNLEQLFRNALEYFTNFNLTKAQDVVCNSKVPNGKSVTSKTLRSITDQKSTKIGTENNQTNATLIDCHKILHNDRFFNCYKFSIYNEYKAVSDKLVTNFHELFFKILSETQNQFIEHENNCINESDDSEAKKHSNASTEFINKNDIVISVVGRQIEMIKIYTEFIQTPALKEVISPLCLEGMRKKLLHFSRLISKYYPSKSEILKIPGPNYEFDSSIQDEFLELLPSNYSNIYGGYIKDSVKRSAHDQEFGSQNCCFFARIFVIIKEKLLQYAAACHQDRHDDELNPLLPNISLKEYFQDADLLKGTTSSKFKYYDTGYLSGYSLSNQCRCLNNIWPLQFFPSRFSNLKSLKCNSSNNETKFGSLSNEKNHLHADGRTDSDSTEISQYYDCEETFSPN